MQVINETYEKPSQFVSSDGRYKASVDYDAFSSAQDAVSNARSQVEEYEKSARAVLLNELEAKKVLVHWEIGTLAAPSGLTAGEIDEWRAKKRQEEGFSVGRLANTIFDDNRMESNYYIFTPASDADVRDFCTLLRMCSSPLADSLGYHKYEFHCGQAQLKKGSRYVVQLGGGSDFPNVEWSYVIDLDALAEGVKALAKFVKNFR